LAVVGFALPPEAEGLLNAKLEAMSLVPPVVATVMGTAPELLGDGLGALVPVDDEDALAGTVIAVPTAAATRDPGLSRRLCDQARRTCSLDGTALRLATPYQSNAHA
jgi:glycosyltransferase involved in cell wall biosynthesis